MNGHQEADTVEQYGTNAERLAYPTAALKQGAEWYETDTTARYKWYGQWVVVVASGGAAPGWGGVNKSTANKIAHPGNGILIGGDSNAANWRTISSSATGITSEKYQKSVITWMLRYADQCATVIASTAKGSTCVTNAGPSPNMYEQMDTFVASQAELMVVISTLNDLELSPTPKTPLEILQAFRDHFAKALAAGKRMLILLENPMSSSWGGYSVLRQNGLLQVNQMLRAEINKVNKTIGAQAIAIAETFAEMVDPASSTANIFSGDGQDHTDNVSGRRGGVPAAAALQELMPYAVPRLPVSNADNYIYGGAGNNVHLNTNALMVNGTTSAGKTVATGYTATTTGSAVITDAYLVPHRYGNWQVIESTGAAANDSARFSMNQGVAIYGQINDGDTIQGVAYVMVQDMVNVKNVRLLCSIANSLLPFTMTAADGQLDGASDVAFSDIDGWAPMTFLTDEIIYSSAMMGALNLSSLEVALFYSAAGGSSRLYVTAMSFEKVYKL